MSLRMQQMTAAVLYGKEQLRIETVQVPKLGPGDVLVRVRAALTCGTDVKVFRRGYHARMIRPPALFGHELAGDVVAVGGEVQGFKVGRASIVRAGRKTCAKTCSSTMAHTLSTFASRRASCRRTCMRFRRTRVIRMRLWWNLWPV
jgi:D-arabinose 1-dehydrogenase-like Zn-dependent alcohol dehydrogenase